jgi:hypothetical protein
MVAGGTPATRPALWTRLAGPAGPAALVGLLYLGLMIFILYQEFDGDPLGFVHSGTYFTEHDPNGTKGYDGQFYYYTALDPADAAGLLDNATFRLQRIFFPLLIRAFALGQAALIPWVMLGLNWGAVVGGTWLVARLLARWGRSPWFALSYGLASGVPVALTFDTAEPLTFALVALGMWWWSPDPAADREPPTAFRARWGQPLGALVFALALLTRELAAFAVAGYAVAALFRRDWRGLGWAAAAWVPIVGWSAYLSITSNYLGVSYAQPLEHIPFLAFWNQLNGTPRSLAYAGQYVIPTVVFGALGGLALLRTWRAPSALLIGLLGNVYLLTFLHAGGYMHQVAVSRYALGMALAAVLWAGSRPPRRLLWLTPIFIVSFVFFLYGLWKHDPSYLW